MSDTFQNDLYLSVLEDISKTKEIGDKELNILRFIFPPALLERALDIVDKKMVQKIIFKPSNKELYQVLSYRRTSTYLCLFNYCTCAAFQTQINNKDVPICKHLIAVELAKALNEVTWRELDDFNYSNILLGYM